MNISFAPLATVSVAHTYYSGACSDIEFVPSAATAAMLRGAHVLARVRDGAVHLLYEATGPGEPLSTLAGSTLHFGLRLANPSFSNITTPPLADASLMPLFANATTPGVLDAAQGVRLAAGIHTHATALATRPVTLRLKDTMTPANVLDTRLLGEATASYDLRGLATGQYVVEEDYGAGVIHTRRLLVDAELRDAGMWGVLALRIDAAFYTSAPAFTLALAARKETLRYYVVASNWASAQFDQINIVDEGAAAAGRTPIVFTRAAEPYPADFIRPSLLGDSDAQVAVFESDIAVARSERGLRKLNLNRSTTVLIEHLPLPGPERAKADLIVHLSKP